MYESASTGAAVTHILPPPHTDTDTPTHTQMHADPRHDGIKKRVELTGRGREKLEYKHVGPSGLSRAAERMCRDKRKYLFINTVATGCSCCRTGLTCKYITAIIYHRPAYGRTCGPCTLISDMYETYERL